MSVLHTREIIYVAEALPGKMNDQTACRHDLLLQQLRAKQIGPDIQYDLYDMSGKKTVTTGLYAIVDNGYHLWWCLICPKKHAYECRWSSRLESVRKDVECTFGVLKKRFKILRLPIQINTAATIADIFKGCCALHNFLLHKDGLNSIGAKGGDWTQDKVVGPNTAASKMPNLVRAPYMKGQSSHEAGRERDASFHDFRQRLIVNYEFMWRQKKVWWCKTAAEVRPKVSGTDERMGEEDSGEEGDREDSAGEDEGEGGDIGSDSDGQDL